VVTTKVPKKGQPTEAVHSVLDVGESANVQERVANHDRVDQWESNRKDGLFFSASYCGEGDRMTMESELRDYFDPPCGKK